MRNKRQSPKQKRNGSETKSSGTCTRLALVSCHLPQRHTHTVQARNYQEKYRKVKKELDELKAQGLASGSRRSSMITTPSTPHPPHEAGDENEPPAANTPLPRIPVPDFDFEGLPKPGFGSDWNLKANREYGSLSGKGRPPVSAVSLNRRVTNPLPGVLRLDRKGQPTSAVQLGPKRSVRKPF